ncbi:MAG: heavy metal translocating P-type ATPase [Halarchaeum sp.]
MACALCGLPADPPVTADDGTVYCCRGCREVAAALPDDAADVDPADARAAVRDDAADADLEGCETAYFAVDGMHCATCEAFLESRAADVTGVRAADASYAGDAVRVAYDPGELDGSLTEALSGYGYRVRERDADPDEGSLTTGARLLLGGVFGMMVMTWYVVFLYPVYLGWGALVPFFDVGGTAGRYLLWNVAVLAGVATALAGYPVFRGAYVSLRARRPNMDLLVSLAALVAYAYSVLVLLRGGHEVYFDVAVVVVLAVTLGEHWEARVKSRAASGLAALADDRPERVRVRTDDGITERPIGALESGDDAVVAAGDRIPRDGTVVDGDGAADESLLTGESAPRDVGVGDDVVGGSVLAAGGVTVRVDAESTFDRVVDALWDVQSTHGGAQRLADRLAAAFVPLVFGVAVLAFAVALVRGAPLDAAMLTALSVLVVSCPCALGLATPLAVSAGVRAALECGTVVTDAGVFERAADVDVVAFDKTGTLTTGDMRVTDVAGDPDALSLAAALEAYADHPVARAVCAHADAPDADVRDVERHARGVSGTVDGRRVRVGRPDFVAGDDWLLPDELDRRARAGDDDGLVPVVVGVDGSARTVALAGDDPREGWREAIEALAVDHRIVVLTGDEGASAERYRDVDAVDAVHAGVPPEGKSAVIDRLRGEGTVAMVGDGTNDAPALAAADLGIAMGSGTALATDAADAVVTGDDVRAVPAVLGVARRTRRRVRENLAWAFCYNAVAVPLAFAGVLNPLLAAGAMAASSLLVVANSARSLGVPDAAERAADAEIEGARADAEFAPADGTRA